MMTPRRPADHLRRAATASLLISALLTVAGVPGAGAGTGTAAEKGLRGPGSTWMRATFTRALAAGCPAGKVVVSITLRGKVVCRPVAGARVDRGSTQGGAPIVPDRSSSAARPQNQVSRVVGPAVAHATFAVQVDGAPGAAVTVDCRLHSPDSEPGADQEYVMTLVVPRIDGASAPVPAVEPVALQTEVDAGVRGSVTLQCTRSPISGAAAPADGSVTMVNAHLQVQQVGSLSFG